MAMLLIPFPGVFQPHSDSWMLADQLGAEELDSGTRVLDICTGSGLLAIRAAQEGAGCVTAIDVSRRAVLAARLNGWLNGVSVRSVRGSLFEPVAGETFDLVVSNPPYVPSADDRLPTGGPERAWDAGVRGRAFLDRICAEAPQYLSPGGILLLVQSTFCSEQDTVDALTRGGLDVAIVARRPGPLGRLASARAAMLRARGLVGADGREEVLIVRAEKQRDRSLDAAGSAAAPVAGERAA